jgi:carbon-monoxide dehydrogenase medium subunit
MGLVKAEEPAKKTTGGTAAGAPAARTRIQMKPPSFDYAAPTTIEEALALLSASPGEAKILAGGQSLMPLLNMRLARPSLLVDMRRVPGLDHITEARGGLVIGAMTTQRSVERSALVKERYPLIDVATRFIAHPQIRNRGTVGGSLAHADPAAEWPAIAVALDAELGVLGPGGTRRISAEEFFVTYLTTAMEPTEVLTEVRLPPPPARGGWAFQEIARRHGDYALAGIAMTMSCDARGRCADPRIVLFGVGSTPLRARGAERLVSGEPPGASLFEAAARAVAADVVEPLSDVHADAEFRRHLAQVVTRRGLAEAAARAAG